MANATTYNIDPNTLKNTALDGTAEIITDQTSAFWTKLFDAANLSGAKETVDTTATALNPLVYLTQLTVSGTMAFTLANGTYSGQTKRIECVSAASTPLGTVTITTPDATAGFVCPSTFIFDTAGQAVELLWTGSAWRVTKSYRAGVKVAVIGTTATAGFNLCSVFSCSVTGTVSSTGANALQNGTYAGDTVIVACSTAASIPNGSLGFVGLTLANVGATALNAIDATTDTVALRWTGSAWLVQSNSGITVA